MSDFRKLIDLTNLYTRYTLLEATAEELAQALYDSGRGKVFGTDEKAIMKALDQIKSPEEFKSVSNAYKAISPRNTELTKDLQDEMSGDDLETLNAALEKINSIDQSFSNVGGDQFAEPAASGTVQQEPAAAEPAAAEPAAAEPAAAKNVPPRPKQPGRGGVIAGQKWDKQYAATYNADGSPKSEVTPAAGTDGVAGIGGYSNTNTGAGVQYDTTGAATSTAPEVDSTAPAQPTTPTANNTAPKIPGADPTGGVGGADAAAKAAPDAKVAQDPTGGVGGADAAAKAAPDAKVAQDPTGGVGGADAAAKAAAVKPPVRPEQQTSGLPAKLAQIKSANLMKDYQAGGKKPMDQVKTIQTALSRAGFDPGKIDGMYGNGVFKAVQDFQKANGLQVDGQVGPATIKALIAKSGGSPKTLRSSDLAQGQGFSNKPPSGGFQNADDPEAQVFAGDVGGAAPTQQNASKDHSMKKAMNESASMNVSMTADTADQVAELMKLLKNAGMSDAAPVSSMMAPMPSMPPMGAAAPKQDSMADFIGMVGGDEMDGPSEPCSVCGEVHEETSCSEDTSEYDAVVAEWDNSPDEEYKDANYMLNDLAGGLNRPKKAYAKAQDGDNAMAVEAIKADLRKALEEALAKK